MKSGWRHVPLGEIIAGFDAGVSVNGMDRPARAGEHGVLKVSAVTEGRFKPEENKAVLPAELQRIGVSPRTGDILISRANTIDLVGASALVDRDYPLLHLSDKLWRVVLADETRDDRTWLSYMLASDVVRKGLRARATGSSASMKNVSQSAFLTLEVPRPPAHQQQKLGDTFQRFDRVIEHLTRLIAAKRALKRALMQELLTGRRRFPEFGSYKDSITRAGRLPADWGVAKLEEYGSELSERNGSRLGPDRAMGVIKGVGLEPMRDHVRGDDLSRYKVVPPQAFAYNPMRINIGSIARSRFADDCLVSPDYVVFEADPSALLPEFLDHLRHSFLWRRFVEAAGAGSVRVRIYFRDLAKLWIPLPSVAEQKRIVDVLDMIDREITLLEAQRDEFEIQRRGLMQKLLSGEIEIPADAPEARYARTG